MQDRLDAEIGELRSQMSVLDRVAWFFWPREDKQAILEMQRRSREFIVRVHGSASELDPPL